MAATHDRAPRWSQLLQLLAERGRLSVAEVCGELGVSEATVRRDFNELAAQQLATRTHGGVLATAVAYDLPARYKSASQDGAKQQIAVAAADLVEPGTVVGLNGGTTTSAVARELASRPEIAASGLRPAVTVVTNALNIATEMVLRPAVRCIGLGGVARSESYEQTGPIAIARHVPALARPARDRRRRPDRHHRRDLPARRRGEHQRRHGRPGRTRGGRDHR